MSAQTKKALGAQSATEDVSAGSSAVDQRPHDAPKSLCACVSDDAARCIALRYPEDVWDWDETEPERCCCFCHDFAGYDE